MMAPRPLLNCLACRHRHKTTLLRCFYSLLLCLSQFACAEFNFEIGERVRERINDTLSVPPIILEQITNYRASLAFPNDFRAPDRDAFLRYDASLMFVHLQFQAIYYGLEDGSFSGVTDINAAYREPGDSGYSIEENGNSTGNMLKHYLSCVDENGHQTPCLLQPGESYVECVDECALRKCPDEESQRDCLTLKDNEERNECEQNIKWCKSYDITQVPRNTSDVQLGYVPRSICCINPYGALSQSPGQIHKLRDFDREMDGREMNELGNCYFRDGITPVKRNLTGDYAYCGGDGAVCNDTFIGCYFSPNYDPRFRQWYVTTREIQKPNWFPPYVFFGTLDIGITYSQPIYDTHDGRNSVFAGVLAVDVTLSDFTDFLTNNYNGTDTIVAIIEKRAPNYVIATSTGSAVVKSVTPDDSRTLCNRDIDTECNTIRLTFKDLKDNPKDVLISSAFALQAEAGFPEAKLIAVNDGSDKLYTSQTLPFITDDLALDWTVIILSPLQTKLNHTINFREPSFITLVVASTVGATFCFSILLLVILNRKKREFALTDWRFTSVFIFGCALFNLASLSMIGLVTDGFCLLQMWLLHFFFVFTLAPLFAKIYRVYRLVGTSNFRRISISHFKTVLIASPIVILQIVILTIFTLVDPIKRVNIIEQEGSDVTHALVCAHDTNAFFAAEALYEGCLVLVGCVLAFKTRNLRKEFAEANQLTFAMYTIALMASLVIIITRLADTTQGAKNAFIAFGIAVATCISSSVFVVPRMIQIYARMRRINWSRHGGETIHAKFGTKSINWNFLGSIIDGPTLEDTVPLLDDTNGSTERI